MAGLLLGLLLLGGQCLVSRARREMMIAAIFDHHHQTSNIQHEIAFRHAVQMVNENRWVLHYEFFFGNLRLGGRGEREGGVTIAKWRCMLAKTILHKKAVQERHCCLQQSDPVLCSHSKKILNLKNKKSH